VYIPVRDSYSARLSIAFIFPIHFIGVGVPAITTTAINLAWVLGDHHAAYLCAPTESAVASAMSTLMGEAAPGKRFGANGRVWVLHDCSPEVVRQALAQFYERGLAIHPRDRWATRYSRTEWAAWHVPVAPAAGGFGGRLAMVSWLASLNYLDRPAILCSTPVRWRGEGVGVTFAFPPRFPSGNTGYSDIHYIVRSHCKVVHSDHTTRLAALQTQTAQMAASQTYVITHKKLVLLLILLIDTIAGVVGALFVNALMKP
jgi:hypothetical protein